MSLQPQTTLFLFILILAAATTATAAGIPETCSANPTEVILETCGSNLVPERRETYDNGRIIDISHRISPEMPCFGSDAGLGEFVWLVASRRNGSLSNNSDFKLFIHTGTHVDSPAHFYTDYLDAGFDVDTLDLAVLNGPVLLVDVPRDSNITEVVMKSLHIPKGGLMFQKEFDSSYTGFMKDGAQWLIDNTDIKLVGIDYLSVAAFDHLEAAHLVFLKSREIILVEGLKLNDVPAGMYNVHCLPLRLLGAEGSPIRCILIK